MDFGYLDLAISEVITLKNDVKRNQKKPSPHRYSPGSRMNDLEARNRASIHISVFMRLS